MKKFRLWDCVLAVVCVVMTLESAAPAAIIGNSQFFWWILLLIGFCLPYGLISAELGTAYEGEGGLCDWVARAFGKRWGARVAWYYWVNFPLWMASVAVLTTDNLPSVLGFEIPDSIAIVIRLVFIWALVLLSMNKLSANKWLFNASTVVKAVIMATLGVAGFYGAAKHGLANPITPASLLPSAGNLAFVSVIVFNFLGFEVVTTFVADMPNPKRDIPKAIVWGGLAIAALYMLASFGIGAAVPSSQISPSMGVLESLGLLLGDIGPVAAAVFGVMLIFGMFTTQLSWSVGINNVACYCAKEIGGMPGIFAKTTRGGTPSGAALMNGIVASALVLIAPLLPSEGLFWSFFALNLVTLLLSYVPLFPAFLKLRREDGGTPRPYAVFGGPAVLRLVAYVPLAFLALALVFTVVPFSSDELADKLPLVVGSVVAILSGELIAARAAKRAAKT